MTRVAMELAFDPGVAGQGAIRGRVEVETGPMGLADVTPIALQLGEAISRRAAQREAGEGRALSCRAGCGACCRQMVPVSIPEAFHVMDLIDAHPERERHALLARFDHVERELEARELIDALLAPRYSADDVALPVARQYFALQLACPFLVEESCSIHAYRPIACRWYSVTSPAALCADPYGNAGAIARVAMPTSLAVPLARLAAKLTADEPRLLPLSLVPRWVKEHDALRRRQWPGLELFQGLMRELGGTPRAAEPAAE